MITAWDVCLWFSGFLAGAGTFAVILRFIPQRFNHHFHFNHRHGFTVRHEVADDDEGEGWKRS